jgi:hypothetical protein
VLECGLKDDEEDKAADDPGYGGDGRLDRTKPPITPDMAATVVSTPAITEI